LDVVLAFFRNCMARYFFSDCPLNGARGKKHDEAFQTTHNNKSFYISFYLIGNFFDVLSIRKILSSHEIRRQMGFC
jgi:hypothetical protein